MKGRSRFWVAIVAVAGGLIAATGIALGALAVRFARHVLTPARIPDEPVEVVSLSTEGEPPTVTLRGADSDLAGQLSFLYEHGLGHARLGEGRDVGPGQTSRPVLRMSGAALCPGSRGRLTGWWFERPEETGLHCETIRYATEGGESWGWLLTPEHPRPGWFAVHVHGRGADPAETLRGVAPLAQAGLTSLVIAYRNDRGAPSGHSSRYGLGYSERRDVEAAIEWLRTRGATDILLVGWSMGGTASMLAANGNRAATIVRGIVLESPALDWAPLLHHHGRLARVPRPVTALGLRLLERGTVRGGEPRGLPLNAISVAALAAGLRVPALVLVGSGDTFVPDDAAHQLARLRPDLVRLESFAGAEHVKLWNVEPDRWEGLLRTFALEIAEGTGSRG